MTEPLSTVCDQCGANLKLKNPDLEGKKIKCPKCGEAFVVVAAGSTGSTKKTVKKQASSGEDDLSFMDVDPDDYGPAPDEEDSEGDDAPRERSRSLRSGKKKSKKKSKIGGGDAGQVVKILAIILVAVLVLGGGGFAMMSLTRGDGSSDLDWLPTDVQGYVKFQVDDVWSAPVFQGFKNSAAGKSFAEEMTKNLGISPGDVDHVIMGLPPGNNQSATVMVTRAKKPFDSAGLTAAEGMQQVSHGGSSYLKKDATTVVFLPDPKTLIRGPETAIQALIDRGKKNPSTGKFSFARSYRDHVVMAMTDSTSNSNNPFSGFGGERSETLLFRANASSDIRLNGDVLFKDAETAKKNVDKAKADIEKGKAGITQSKSQIQQMPAMPGVNKDQILKMMNGSEQMMNSMQFSQSGSRMYLQMTITGQLVNDFVEMAGSMPTSPLNRFSTPFGK